MGSDNRKNGGFVDWRGVEYILRLQVRDICQFSCGLFEGLRFSRRVVETLSFAWFAGKSNRVLGGWGDCRHVSPRTERHTLLSATFEENAFVYIVDDDPAARESVAALVQSRGMQTKTFASAEEFLKSAHQDEVRGCLVLDVRMKGMGGLDLQEELQRRHISLPVIIITGYADVPMAVRALQGGAVSFLTKPCKPENLWGTILQAVEQDRTERRKSDQQRAIERKLAMLTSDERLVLSKILEGVPNKRIARDLDIGLRTVELRRSNLMKKMEAESLAELIQMVLQVNFPTPESVTPATPEES